MLTMRLPTKEIDNLSSRALWAYYRLEVLAGGGAALSCHPADLALNYCTRSIRGAFRELAQTSLYVQYAGHGYWRVQWPAALDLDAVYERLCRLDAVKSYPNFSRQYIEILSAEHPSLSARGLEAAVAGAITQAYEGDVKPRNLIKWLRRGLQQEAASASNQPKATPENNEQTEHTRWDTRIRKSLEDRPSPTQLYSKLPRPKKNG